MLPIRELPRGTFTFEDGTVLEIRGLSRAEAIQLRGLGADVAAVEALCISKATGVTQAETQQWLDRTPSGEVEALVNAIAKLSGLDPDEGKADVDPLHSVNGTESTTSLPRTSASL